MTHVLLNLVKNAYEAMPERGTLTLTTRIETDYHIRRPSGAGRPAGSGQFLRIEVADTGPGFSNDVIIEKLEARGLRVHLASKAEWVAYCGRVGRERRGNRLADRFAALVEHRIEALAWTAIARHLGWPAPPSIPDLLDVAQPYVNEALNGEAVFSAPHGAVCARLLPLVMEINIKALESGRGDHSWLDRYDEVAEALTHKRNAKAMSGVDWVYRIREELNISPLGEYGLTDQHIRALVEKSSRASSMKGNPVELTVEEMTSILLQAI